MHENGDCQPIIVSSPDEGYGELNVSDLVRNTSSEYIVPDNVTPEKKTSGLFSLYGSFHFLDISLLTRFIDVKGAQNYFFLFGIVRINEQLIMSQFFFVV